MAVAGANSGATAEAFRQHSPITRTRLIVLSCRRAAAAAAAGVGGGNMQLSDAESTNNQHSPGCVGGGEFRVRARGFVRLQRARIIGSARRRSHTHGTYHSYMGGVDNHKKKHRTWFSLFLINLHFFCRSVAVWCDWTQCAAVTAQFWAIYNCYSERETSTHHTREQVAHVCARTGCCCAAAHETGNAVLGMFRCNFIGVCVYVTINLNKHVLLWELFH